MAFVSQPLSARGEKRVREVGVRERTHTFVTEKDCKGEGKGVRKKERARARE